MNGNNNGNKYSGKRSRDDLLLGDDEEEVGSTTTTTTTTTNETGIKHQQGKEDDQHVHYDTPQVDPCAICLENIDVKDRAFLDICFHHFCYICILQWSQVNDKCPICKSQFNSLLYDIKSSKVYKRYYISKYYQQQHKQQNETNNQLNEILNNDQYLFRKSIYEKETSSIPMVPLSRFKLEPKQINNAWKARVEPWIERELKYIVSPTNDSMTNINILVELVLSLLTKYPLDSVEVKTTLSKYLGDDKAKIFAHELLCFSTSNLSIKAYDLYVDKQQHVI